MRTWIVIRSRKRLDAWIVRGLSRREVRKAHPGVAIYAVPSGHFVDNRTPSELIELADRVRYGQREPRLDDAVTLTTREY